MSLMNSNSIQKVVMLEKKLVNFLTNEQLEEIARCEKEILNDLVNAKMSYEQLQQKYGVVVSKLESIGINVNSILNSSNSNDEEEDYDEEED